MPFLFDVEFAASKITRHHGASGSGKSTLLNLVAGFETPQSGRVLIGAPMLALPRLRHGRSRWCSRKTISSVGMSARRRPS